MWATSGVIRGRRRGRSSPLNWDYTTLPVAVGRFNVQAIGNAGGNGRCGLERSGLHGVA